MDITVVIIQSLIQVGGVSRVPLAWFKWNMFGVKEFQWMKVWFLGRKAHFGLYKVLATIIASLPPNTHPKANLRELASVYFWGPRRNASFHSCRGIVFMATSRLPPTASQLQNCIISNKNNGICIIKISPIEVGIQRFSFTFHHMANVASQSGHSKWGSHEIIEALFTWFYLGFLINHYPGLSNGLQDSSHGFWQTQWVCLKIVYTLNYI